MGKRGGERTYHTVTIAEIQVADEDSVIIIKGAAIVFRGGRGGEGVVGHFFLSLVLIVGVCRILCECGAYA